MMDTIRIREIAVDEGMPVGTVEKELALVCVLHALSKDRFGGTSASKEGQRSR